MGSPKMLRSEDGVVRTRNGDRSFRNPISKQRLEKSKEELKDQATEVLEEAKKIECIASSNKSGSQEKFYTLPNRRKGITRYDTFNEKRNRKNGLELVEIPPKKSPRHFTTSDDSGQFRPGCDIFKNKQSENPRKSNLHRSVSDASNVKSKIFKQTEEAESDWVFRSYAEDSKLFPIIEVQQRADYLSHRSNESNEKNNQENIIPKTSTGETCKNSEEKGNTTESSKKYIDKINEKLFRESGVTIKRSDQKNTKPDIIIIDVNRAKQISRNKNSKTFFPRKKLKSLTFRKNTENCKITKKVILNDKIGFGTVPRDSLNPKSKKTTNKLKSAEEICSNMMHSSQKPAEKPPLTKGTTVDTMVRRLSKDSPILPPPKTNILVTPNVFVQHNSNQPFSYTKSISLDKYHENDSGSPIIYAQVICANGASGPSKQTVHTVFTSNVKKQPHYSDSDEGLGYEEHSNRKYRPDESHFPKNEAQCIPEFKGLKYFIEGDEPLISSKIRATNLNDSCDNSFAEIERGRADGMDAKRRGSLSESIENVSPKMNYRTGNISKSDWSARRDLLESRIKRKLFEKVPRDILQNNANMLFSESTSKYYKNKTENPVNFPGSHTDLYANRYIVDSRNNTYLENPKNEVEYKSTGHFGLNYIFGAEIQHQRLLTDRNIFQSNPEINDDSKEPHLVDSYHDSLRRGKRIYRFEKYLDHNEDERKDKFGDSGIENDIRRDCIENLRAEPRRIYGMKTVDSEDEGFASSLLIASERQHTDEAVNTRMVYSDYDYGSPYGIDEYDYRKRRNEFIPNERCIDDGSHYDLRIDTNFENERQLVLKKTEEKLPKKEKKSGLEKVKKLFMSSSRKKGKQLMVKEEDLRSRYVEYRGSTERFEPEIKKGELREVNTPKLGDTSAQDTKEVQSNPSLLQDTNTNETPSNFLSSEGAEERQLATD